jgi:hypothetical protein
VDGGAKLQLFERALLRGEGRPDRNGHTPRMAATTLLREEPVWRGVTRRNEA